ncbi:MAG: extracellular solute-binding protein [Trueperaceae bacterium]|nr:extracellular solute-binding protein [Trueperaceae bacterium]
MQARILKWSTATLFVIMFAAPAFAQSTVEVICRCVEDGVNAEMVQWLQEDVFPAFEAHMEEQGQEVNAELVQFGGSDEALEQQYALDLSVGRGPDVLAFDGFWVPDFVEAEYLEPLDQIAGEQVWDWDGWDAIPEGLRDLIGFDGEIYGLGIGTDVRMIFYRTDLFEEAGIETPWQPESWADLLDTARTIQSELDGVTPLQLNAGAAMGEATTMQGYFMALLGTGIHMYDFEEGTWYGTHPGILDTLELYETIYLDEELGSERIQLVSQGREQSFEGFRDGEIAMLVEGDWFWRSVMAPGSEWEPEAGRDAVVSWAKMPAREPGSGYGGHDFVSISGGTGFALNPNTDEPDLSWELMSFMFSKEMQDAFQEIQPRIRIRTDVPVTGDPDMSRMAEEILPFSTVRPQLPEYARISEAAQRMTERVVSGQMTPQEAMEAYADAIEEIAGEENVTHTD